MRISAAGKNSLLYDPRISCSPTFRSRFCRKFCDLYASIYGNGEIIFEVFKLMLSQYLNVMLTCIGVLELTELTDLSVQTNLLALTALLYGIQLSPSQCLGSKAW